MHRYDLGEKSDVSTVARSASQFIIAQRDPKCVRFPLDAGARQRVAQTRVWRPPENRLGQASAAVTGYVLLALSNSGVKWKSTLGSPSGRRYHRISLIPRS